jgi:hypothetical protein
MADVATPRSTAMSRHAHATVHAPTSLGVPPCSISATWIPMGLRPLPWAQRARQRCRVVHVSIRGNSHEQDRSASPWSAPDRPDRVVYSMRLGALRTGGVTTAALGEASKAVPQDRAGWIRKLFHTQPLSKLAMAPRTLPGMALSGGPKLTQRMQAHVRTRADRQREGLSSLHMPPIGQTGTGARRKTSSSADFVQRRLPTQAVRACTGTQVGTPVGITTGIKLRGSEGAQRLRATSASMSDTGRPFRFP